MIATAPQHEALAICEQIMLVCERFRTLPDDGLGPNIRGGEADTVAAQVLSIWNWINYNGKPTKHQTLELARLSQWAQLQN